MSEALHADLTGFFGNLVPPALRALGNPRFLPAPRQCLAESLGQGFRILRRNKNSGFRIHQLGYAADVRRHYRPSAGQRFDH